MPTGFVEYGFALPAYVTWQLETLEQEEQECLEVTDMVVACPLPCVLPTALGCALQWCPPGGRAPCKATVSSLVSLVMLRLQLCPTSLVPIPSSGWQLGWGVSHNASGMIPRLTIVLGSATSGEGVPWLYPPPRASHPFCSLDHTPQRRRPTL